MARSLGMWLQSKLKSNHMWITFPHECNDFRRLINVKQCLSCCMHTFPGEIGKIAAVSWFNFPSLVFWGDVSTHNKLSMFITAWDVLPFCLFKSPLQNIITVNFWRWEKPKRSSLALIPFPNQPTLDFSTYLFGNLFLFQYKNSKQLLENMHLH